MSTDKKIQPIIVKKIKKGGHGHHGGAWKIAYADFVTAMMAFFLLMWLLGSTTKGDLKGISDVFNTPLKVAMAGGSGSGDSTSIIDGGGQDLTRSVGQIKRGDIDPKDRTKNPHALANENKRLEGKRLGNLKAALQKAIAKDAGLEKLSDQVRLDMTAEGLRIQIVDDKNRPMFASGNYVVSTHIRDLMREIGRLLNNVENRISISGHTDATPFSGNGIARSNWELSTERANASRRELISGGMDPNKLLRVVGMASSVPFDRSDRFSPVNRRISIVVLTEEAASTILSDRESVNLEKEFEESQQEAQYQSDENASDSGAGSAQSGTDTAEEAASSDR